MHVLVTGATGFVGLSIAQRLATYGESVVALDRDAPDAAATQFLSAEQGRLRFVRGDVRDRAALIELVQREGIQRIVHAAALTPTPDDERADPAAVIDVNLVGTLNLLEAARHGAVERLVFVSSTAVYGSPEGRPLPIHEDQALTAKGMYAVAKHASEQLCARYAELYRMSIAVGRLGSAYGPTERRTASRRRMSQVYALAHAALDGRVITIAGAGLLRDVCYIDDVAEAFARLTRTNQLRWPVYNVSAGEAHSLHAIALALAELVPGFSWREANNVADADLVVLPPNARGPLDLSRLHADTGFVPAYPLPQGLRRYLQWLRAA
ncbi:MAG: NAD(P)-dependent oxidoreductase [Chloroflexales bacterium]|nr:NAD(P)-dependent oxidoreductase [Chloroflexales bacterium]